SQLQTLPVASEHEGAWGIYVNEVGAWEARITPDEVAERIGSLDTNVLAFEPRTERLRLKPWDEADLRRLDLPLSLLATQQEDEEWEERLEREKTEEKVPRLYSARLIKEHTDERKVVQEAPRNAKEAPRHLGRRSSRLRGPKSHDHKA